MKEFLLKTIRQRFFAVLPNGVYVFNYHRIGERSESLFDPTVFSCSESEFEEHLIYLQEHFTIISTNELVELSQNDASINKRYAVITFDDGYRDNYTIAYPLLKKYGMPATFFVATDYLSNGRLAWWDQVAWLVRHCKTNAIRFSDDGETVCLPKGPVDYRVRMALKEFKKDDSTSIDDKLNYLQAFIDLRLPDALANTNLFMSWSELYEMTKNGMYVGSHTVSHNILSQLNDEEQFEELFNSKGIIETKLQCNVEAIAYPVGGIDCFDDVSRVYAKQIGYKIGFSFEKGIISNFVYGCTYQLPRLSVEGGNLDDQIKQTLDLGVAILRNTRGLGKALAKLKTANTSC